MNTHMKRTRYVAFLGLVWYALFAPSQHVVVQARAYQCNSTGVVVQDNFNQYLDGWFCYELPDYAETECDVEQEYDCEHGCDYCGGTFTSSNNCYWGADYTLQGYGSQGLCAPTRYAQWYVVDCNCYYEPPTCIDTCLAEKPGYNFYMCDCECGGGYWAGEGCSGSPVLINLQDNGTDHLTSARNGVAFDINATGRLENVAWTDPNAPVAFVVLDRNGNGTIDNGSELFGTATKKRDGMLAGNGFEALADLDDNADGRIDRVDAVYGRLRLWTDVNHNGLSEPGELVPLGDAGITAIITHYRESQRTDEYGNWYRYEGRAEIIRNGKQAVRRVFDVFLAIARR